MSAAQRPKSPPPGGSGGSDCARARHAKEDYIAYHRRWAARSLGDAAALKPFWWNRREIRRLKALALSITQIMDDLEARYPN